MSSTTSRTGGRPPTISVEEIVETGAALGMHRLSLNAVAAALGVTSTAMYRHVGGRWELERLVGERILAGLELDDDPRDDVERHLLACGMRLRAFTLEHPGLARYLQTLFPRGDAGRRLLASEVAALGRRGYGPDAAIVVASGVASVAIGLAAAEELQLERVEGLDDARAAALADLEGDERLGSAHLALPAISYAQHARLMLSATIAGLVAAAPPGREVADVVAALDPMGAGTTPGTATTNGAS